MGCVAIKWGNHFVITYELDYPVDSIRMNICDEETVFYHPYEGSPANRKNGSFEGNVATPEDGYPCLVRFKLYSGSTEYLIEGESFDCNHCDVSHIYYLGKDTVYYEVIP